MGPAFHALSQLIDPSDVGVVKVACLQGSFVCASAGRLTQTHATLAGHAQFEWAVCAGAIPVIVGPPFNALPLSHLIDYSDVGVVFNITGPTPWLDNPHPRWLEIPTDAPASSFSNPINIIQVGAGCPLGAHPCCNLTLWLTIGGHNENQSLPGCRSSAV